MIVKSLNNFSNSSSRANTSRSKGRAESKSFEDILSGTQQKKKTALKVNRKPTKKKKVSADNLEESGYSRRLEASKKKSYSEARKPGSISKVNDQKFSQGSVPPKNINPESKEQVAESSTSNQEEKLLTSGKNNSFESTFSKNSEKGQEAGLSINSSGELNKTLDKNSKNNLESLKEQVTQFLKNNNPAAQNKQFSGIGKQVGVNAVQTQDSQGKESGKATMSSSLMGIEAALGLKPAQSKSSSGQSSTSSEEGHSSNLQALLGQGFENEASIETGQDSLFVQKMNEVDGQSSEKIENMQSVIKHARTFIKDGGGEMQIELSPEGLGKLQLRVAVENGQVSVKMTADNDVARRALEEGLSEMKTSLESHKLLVDTLKVEMNQDYNKDFSDLANHAQEQENRDFAQQFLGEFRQGREEKFGGVVEGFRNFRENDNEQNLALNTRQNTYMENGKGSSLNVVA